MGDFSASDAAVAGFRFVRERPRVILVWAGVYLLMSLVMSFVMITAFGPLLAELDAVRTQHDPALAIGLLSKLVPFYLVLLLFSLAMYAVIYATACRAVLRPGDDRFAYLRLGVDEVRQGLLILLSVAVVIGCYLLMVAGVVVVAIVATGLKKAGAGFGAGLVILVAVLSAICAWVFVWVRLSLAWPLTFDRGRVNLFGSWALTRGRFWKLLGAYFLAALLAILVGFLLLLLSVAVAAALGGGLAQLFRPDMSSPSAYFAPGRLALTVIWAIAMVLIWPIVLVPPVEIYRRLAAPESPAVPGS